MQNMEIHFKKDAWIILNEYSEKIREIGSQKK
jgi:hypothetical protein